MVGHEIRAALIGDPPKIAARRQQVPSVHIVEAQIAPDTERRKRSFQMGGRAHRSVYTNIVSFNERRDLAQIAGIEVHVGVELVAIGKRFETPVQGAAQMAEAIAGTIGARRRARKPDHHTSGPFRINRKVRARNIESRLPRAQFKIDAAIGDFDRGNQTQRHVTRSTQPLDKLDYVPRSIAALHQIQGRFHKPQRGKTHLPQQQFVGPQTNVETTGMGEGLQPEPRIFVDGDIFERETRNRKQRKVNLVEVYLAPERSFESAPTAGPNAAALMNGAITIRSPIPSRPPRTRRSRQRVAGLAGSIACSGIDKCPSRGDLYVCLDYSV